MNLEIPSCRYNLSRFRGRWGSRFQLLGAEERSRDSFHSDFNVIVCCTHSLIFQTNGRIQYFRRARTIFLEFERP